MDYIVNIGSAFTFDLKTAGGTDVGKSKGLMFCLFQVS